MGCCRYVLSVRLCMYIYTHIVRVLSTMVRLLLVTGAGVNIANCRVFAYLIEQSNIDTVCCLLYVESSSVPPLIVEYLENDPKYI